MSLIEYKWNQGSSVGWEIEIGEVRGRAQTSSKLDFQSDRMFALGEH